MRRIGIVGADATRARLYTVHELGRNLVRLTRAQLHDHLCGRGLLPERARLGA